MKSKHIIILVVWLVTLLNLAANVSGEPRTWTSEKGDTLTAELKEVSEDGQTVTLTKADGSDFKIEKNKLSSEDMAYVVKHQLDSSDKPVVFYKGTNMTFSISKDGVLHLTGTGSKTTWPDGREEKQKLSRHSYKPVGPKPETKRSVVVKEDVHWTNLNVTKLISLVENAISRTDNYLRDKASLKPWSMEKKLELFDDRLGGFDITLRSIAALDGIPPAKAKMLREQGDLAFMKITIFTGDGNENNDLTELTEELGPSRMRSLLRALKALPSSP